MIKVIDKTPHKSVVKQVVCDNCGVTLEYVPADIKSQSYSDYGGGHNTDYYIDCPDCNHRVILAKR